MTANTHDHYVGLSQGVKYLEWLSEPKIIHILYPLQ